jgi:hypothetical protein
MRITARILTLMFGLAVLWKVPGLRGHAAVLLWLVGIFLGVLKFLAVIGIAAAALVGSIAGWGAWLEWWEGREAKRARQDDVEWHAVTMFEDGGEEWKSNDPVKVASREEVAQRKFAQKLLRNDPDALWWQWVEGPARAKALERERALEEEQARPNKREAYNRKQMALRRLMGTTVKRLAAAINRVGPTRVTKRELRAAFSEFLVDAEKDKSLSEPCEYRQWLWADRNTVYLAPVGRRKRGGNGAGGRVTDPEKPN